MGRFIFFTAGALICGQALTSHAQWVDFEDQTATRLTLSAFADDPAGDPLDDEEEKDMAVADLDRDGDMDLIVVRKRPFSTPGARQDILLMNEGGTLVDRTADLAAGFRTTLTDARDVFIGDFTGDEWPDVVIANTFEEQPRFYRNLGEDAGGWLGLADESATRLPTLTGADVSTVQFCAVWGGDVSGDGAMDLYFANYNPLSATSDILLVNDGAGVFTNETSARLGTYAEVAFGTSVEIHDMDADGDRDIVKISTLYATDEFPIGQFILFNDGGAFDLHPKQAMDTDDPYMFTVGDFNGDGMLDTYNLGDQTDKVSIAQSQTPDTSIAYSTFALANNTRTLGFGGNTKALDADGDGDLDMGVAPIDVDIQNCGDATAKFSLLRNGGDGRFVDPFADDANIHINPHDFAMLDVNGDACTDIVMGLCTGWRVFIQNDCAGDSDDDAINDDHDNCTLAANADQRDSNGDGYGNACDADLNDDGVINAGDLGLLRAVFFTADADADFDGDGVVNVVDLGLMKDAFFGAPGPSALAP